jgi:catechol-2,3-dioxygenase
VKFRRIVEKCVYSSDLDIMKDFYVEKIGLEFVSEEKESHVFIKAGKSMLLIFLTLKILALKEIAKFLLTVQ